MKDQSYYDGIIAKETKAARQAMKAYDFEAKGIPADFVQSDQMKKLPAPPFEKPIPDDALLIALPSIEQSDQGRMPLIEAMRKRRSLRRYSEEALTLDELAFLCWAVMGIHEVNEKNHHSYRTSPSGGGRHPFEMYLGVNRVDGLQPGLYRYSALTHKLILLRSGENLIEPLAGVAIQGFIKDCAVLFIWTIIPYRHEWRYLCSGAKPVAMDMGHYCENLYLAAESMHAGACAIASYDQEMLDEFLGVDGEDEFTIYLCPVGRPPQSIAAH
jgi:SagB-type dehydrogenase family enzyme